LETATSSPVTVQITYVDAAVDRSISAPKLIEARTKSYLKAPATDTAAAVDKA
jgi:hypothetical protein